MKLDHRSRPALGFLFITVSLVAVVQSGRELIFWEVGERRDEDHPVLHELPFTLAIALSPSLTTNQSTADRRKPNTKVPFSW